MPSMQTAKQVGENALRNIGAFPASQSQADEGELRTSLKWLEMMLNSEAGISTITSFIRVVDIPVEAGVGDYNLTDYADTAEAQNVFSVSLVDNYGNVDPLTIMYESQGAEENLKDTGAPKRAVITRAVEPVLKVYPMPVQSNVDAGQVLRVRFQTYHDPIDSSGAADSDLRLRPSWYLWCTKALAYELGCGPVRRLTEAELNRLRDDAMVLKNRLMGRDGQYNSSQPPIQDPMAGS